MANSYVGTKQLFFTDTHEWISYYRNHACIGVSDFKLAGIGPILHIKLNTLNLYVNKGDKIGLIISKEYEIPVIMPVNGKLIDYNDYLLSNPDALADKGLRNKWLLKILPSDVNSADLLLPENVYMNKVNISV